MIKPQTLTTLKESRIILKLGMLSKLFKAKDEGILSIKPMLRAMIK
jgi:hypothetical protein